MGFQNFLKTLLGSKDKEPVEPKPDVGRVGFYEEQTGYNSIRDADFASAYSIWMKSTYFPEDRVRALALEKIVENLDNRSGYVREFCLRALILRDDSSALIDVLARLNDYVPINRNLATQLVVNWAAKIQIEELIDLLPEFSAVSRQSRAQHALIYAALNSRFDNKEGHQAI